MSFAAFFFRPKLGADCVGTRIIFCLAALFLIGLGGCKKKAAPLPAPVAETPTPPLAESAATPLEISPTPQPTPTNRLELDSLFAQTDGTIALQRARTICGLGSRAYATPGYRQTLAWLRSELSRLGWHTVYQAFDAKTPAGDRTYTNLIATWPNEKAQSSRVIFTAHFDSPGSKVTTFPAASESAAGCGILLELAERLAATPDVANRVELVFFDGEEPAQQISAADGLCGSRFYLHSLSENDQVKNYRALIGFGAVGHNGAHWTLPIMTNSVLNHELQAFAAKQQWSTQIVPIDHPLWGPHLPALQAGLPATFLHDGLFSALGTMDDSPDQLSAVYLRRAALAALQILRISSNSAGKTPD